jgi:hypothetical protein
VEEQGSGSLLLAGSRELGLTPTSSGESLSFSKTTPVPDSPLKRDNSPHYSTDRVASRLSEHDIPDLYVASFLEARPVSSFVVVRCMVLMWCEEGWLPRGASADMHCPPMYSVASVCVRVCVRVRERVCVCVCVCGFS